jgi:hypothetical protein
MKRLLVLILLGLALIGVGCQTTHNHSSKPAPESPLDKPMVMSYVDFSVCLTTNKARSFDCRYISNDLYVIPTEDWFRNQLPAIIKQFQFDVKQGEYEANANDCDTFTKVAVVAARLSHLKANSVSETSIPIGEYYFTRADGAKHAIICGLVRTGMGQYKMMFLEPQTCKVIELSDKERESCSHILF